MSLDPMEPISETSIRQMRDRERPPAPWYATRKKFKGDEAMLDRARKIDASMLKWAGHWPQLAEGNEPTYRFPKIDLGKTSWSRFEPTRAYYFDTVDREGDERPSGYFLHASTATIPDFPDDVIPPYLLDVECSGLLDEDPGFEDFGGGQCSTVVYFVQGAFSGLIKIGIASNMQQRLGGLRTSSAEPLFVLQKVPANQTFERYLHGLFEPLKCHGEWFYPHWSIFALIGALDC